jgi:hypothetical protein
LRRPRAAGDDASGDSGSPEIVVEEAGASGVADGIAGFVAKLSGTISRALDDMSSLEVSTYVTGDMTSIYVEEGQVIGAALRAYTRVSLDGDTIVCLPERDGEVDRALLEIHGASVKQAQEARCELMRTIVEAAARLTGPGR